MRTLISNQCFKKYVLNIGMIALLISCQIAPLFTKPIIFPSTAMAQGAIPLQTVGSVLSIGVNILEELQKAIRVAGDETRTTLEKLKDVVETLVNTLEATYQDNLNVTLNSLDDVTRTKLLEIEELVTSINQQLQADIKLASQEAQIVIKTATQQIEDLSNELEQSLKEVIVLGGKTAAYIIDRSTYNLILVISIIFLGVGLLLFIWLLFSQTIPQDITGTLTFFLISVYLTSFSGLAFVPHFRGQVMAFTGVGLERSLTKVASKPSIFDVIPNVITLEKTKEIEIWGNSLLLDGKPPKVTISESDVEVKAFSDTKIVLNVADLDAVEGSTNLELTYDNQEKLFAIVNFKNISIPPDLVITNLVINPDQPLQKRNTQVTISLKNLGESEANNFILEWKPLANAPGKSIRVNNLKPGESKDFSDNFAYPNLGVFDTVVTVDSRNNIAESNEANNSISRQIQVRKAPLRQAKITVTFTEVTIDDATDGGKKGEIYLNFDINGEKYSWHKKKAKSGKSYKVKKVFQVTLKESEKLNIYINGFEKDLNFDDPMGSVNKEFTVVNNWGEGNHNHTSNCPQGCYTIHYNIRVDWLN